MFLKVKHLAKSNLYNKLLFYICAIFRPSCGKHIAAAHSHMDSSADIIFVVHNVPWSVFFLSLKKEQVQATAIYLETHSYLF